MLWAWAPTKQSHKPSVDLASDDCDTSLRSSRVGASLNPEALCSAVGLPPAPAPAGPGRATTAHHLAARVCICVCEYKVSSEVRGGLGSGVFLLTNNKSKGMQKEGALDHNTNSNQVNARMALNYKDTQAHCWETDLTEEDESGAGVIKAEAVSNCAALPS